MTRQSRAAPTLIQGISQQAQQLRREGQCEDQLNCLNSPVIGSEARTGGKVLSFTPSLDLTNAFFHDIRRDRTEQYVAAIFAGDLKVFNLITGAECAVTFPDGKSYLSLPIGKTAEQNFTAVSVDDITIIGNRTKIMAMGAAVAPLRQKEACFYFKAGAYKTKYSVALSYLATTYKWEYETPDNSVSSNAPYINTEQLAATFYRAMTGSVATGGATGGGLVGGTYAGDTSVGVVVPPGGSPTLASLGFSIEIDGNVVRIFRTDGVDFSISVSDGQGGKQLIAFKDSIESFNDLPKSCFLGYVCKVAGESKTKDDDYYVQFTGATGSSGVWKETLKPGTQTGLDALTMPHVLENTAPNTFVFKKAAWGSRISGDGDITSPDPAFIGSGVQSLDYDRSRLGLMTDYSSMWSKARKNLFTFFPDTAQTSLATDPVGIEPSYKRTPELRFFTAVGGLRLIWADGVQFRINTKNETFKNETSEADPLTNFEISSEASPLAVGSLLYFGVDHGDFSSIRDIVVENERPGLDNTTTAHVPRLLPQGLRYMAGSDTINSLLAHCRTNPGGAYLYQWLFTDEGRAQQAWSRWQFPEATTVLWYTFDTSTLRLLQQRPDGLIIEEIDLSPLGQSAAQPDRLRLDHSLTQDDCVVTYDGVLMQSTITLPYEVDPGDVSLLSCIQTTTDNNYSRGYRFSIVSCSGNSVVIQGDLTVTDFLIGYVIRSTRTFSEFYHRDQNGTPLANFAVTIERVIMYHGLSGYYRAEVDTGSQTFTYEFQGKSVGDPSEAIEGLTVSEGQMEVPVQQDSRSVTITLINDSPFPSSWITAQWLYNINLVQ